ncbi:hypothetical protein CMI47_23295 [Candidatus Pacearchaeota archaeon]|nr:hypothetical protein [Candidatus Pacearchaeota archaeon]
MKIALCISGKPTGFETTYGTTRENIMRDRNVDVFLHCWETDSITQKKILSLYRPVAYEDFMKK